MKLVYNVHSEARYAEANFPLKLRPFDDELFSSWLIRLALKHRTMPSTFTNLFFPETRNKLWAADADLEADSGFINAVSIKSGIPPDALVQMTLKSYEGWLFESICPKNRGTPFVNPLGMRGRRNRLPGMRFCPQCLLEDEQPYFRKQWRLSLSVACLKHQCFLFDRCPHCNEPVTPYIACKTGFLGLCPACKKDIGCGCVTDFAPNDVLVVVEEMRKIYTDGFVLIEGMPVYSHLYFSVLHQILKLFMSKSYGPKLCRGVGMDFSSMSQQATFELIPLRAQVSLLVKAVWLLDHWPDRFVDVCTQQKVLSSGLLRDFDPAPFWYWKVVDGYFYKPSYMPTDEEIVAAIEYMKREKAVVSEAALSRLLGVRQVFRKRKSVIDWKSCS